MKKEKKNHPHTFVLTASWLKQCADVLGFFLHNLINRKRSFLII